MPIMVVDSLLNSINKKRVVKLMHDAIDVFKLDLKNLTVFTEAATGYYMLTPIVAALANASKVIAITHESSYGNVEEIKKQTLEFAEELEIKGSIEIIEYRDYLLISEADIITNLGFVRPINQNMINRLKNTAAIPLMWETWEYREYDLDLSAARQQGICVLGTNEHHSKLKTFNYIGHLSLKMLYEVSIEGYRAKVVVIGCGEFAEIAVKTLIRLGAIVSWIKTDENCSHDLTKKYIENADVLMVIDHINDFVLIGNESTILPKSFLSSINPNIVVLHICGNVDRADLVNSGFLCWPEIFAPTGYMSVTTDYLGPKPLIDLHTAGLKIGEMLVKERFKGLSSFDAECEVLKKSSLAQGFAGYHPNFKHSDIEY